MPTSEVRPIRSLIDPRSALRRFVVLPLLALLATLTLGAGHAWATSDDWTAAQAAAALREDDLVVLPNSIARLDEARVRTLIAAEGSAVKVLVVPPGPLDSEANRAYQSRISDVEDLLREDWDGDLVTVVGLDVGYSILAVAPSRLWSTRLVLSTLDPTEQVDSAIRHARTGDTGDDPVEPTPTPSDPAEVARMIEALTADPILVEPGADAISTQALARWEEATGRGLRVVALPPLDPGQQQRATAADLAPAFPDDDVVLFQGLWFELAGPDQTLLTVARDTTVSTYQSFLYGRDIGPANILNVLRDEVAEFTSGAVTDQPSPVQRNPVAWLLLALPVLAVGVIVVFGLRRRRTRRQDEVIRTRHDGIADLAAAAALLPAIAQGILALDDLARDSDAKQALGLATVRYRAARDLVRLGQDGPGAWKAARSAQEALTEAADRLGVPNVPGTLAPEEVR